MKKNETIGILLLTILNLIFLLISDLTPKFVYPFFMLIAFWIGIYTKNNESKETTK